LCKQDDHRFQKNIANKLQQMRLELLEAARPVAVIANSREAGKTLKVLGLEGLFVIRSFERWNYFLWQLKAGRETVPPFTFT